MRDRGLLARVQTNESSPKTEGIYFPSTTREESLVRLLSIVTAFKCLRRCSRVSRRAKEFEGPVCDRPDFDLVMSGRRQIENRVAEVALVARKRVTGEVNDLKEKKKKKEASKRGKEERDGRKMWEVEKAILYICNRSRNKGRATLSRGWSTYIESSSFSMIELHVLAACATTIAVSGNTITITNHHHRYWYCSYLDDHIEPFCVCVCLCAAPFYRLSLYP